MPIRLLQHLDHPRHRERLQGFVDCYIEHVVHGVSMREIARRRGIHASTVLRRVRTVEDARDHCWFDAIMLEHELRASSVSVVP